MQARRSTWALALVVLSGSCGSPEQAPRDEVDDAADAEIRALLHLPATFQIPFIPPENPPTAGKIELGRRLFHDRALSVNGTQACVDCHVQALAFTDGTARSTGATGVMLERNSQGLANVAYNASYTWASDGLLTLEQQIHIPLTSDNPIELGLTDGVRDSVLNGLAAAYGDAFREAFPDGDGSINLTRVVFALASFCRTLTSYGSPYDRYLAGETSALTQEQQLGAELFFGERFECFHCHNGALMSGSYRDRNDAEPRLSFFNNGLYNVDGQGSYPAYDQGLYDLTGNPDHRGLFRPPSLRNVEFTAPYMHDGSIATLREVVQHYVAGGRVTLSGPNAGDGRTSPLKSGLVRPFTASPTEIDAVVAFLNALSDVSFITDTRLGPPSE